MDKNKVKVPEKFKSHPLFNELICGTNFGFLSKRGYYSRPEVLKQPEIMKDLGINWTTVNMNICQDKFCSEKLYLDFEYTTGEMEMFEIIKRLHDNGIRVLFKPCLTCLDGAAMGAVGFPDRAGLSQIQGVETDYWKNWFNSYIECAKYFSDFAERAGVDALMIGAELLGTEGQNEHWEKVIENVRNHYSQPITYEFTHASRKRYNLDWIKKVDFLSYSYYPPACAPNMEHLDPVSNPEIVNNPHFTKEDMMDYLSSRKKRIQSISERFDNLPIAFTEFGVRSAHGCIMQPYNFLWDTPYDGEEQANYMDAAFETFFELDCFMGLFWWKWDETQHRPHYHDDPTGDRGFTIQGKPAEKIMQKWNKKLL